MKKNQRIALWKRLITLVLVFAMVMQNVSTVMATGIVDMTESDVVQETTAETQAPTEAPETQAPTEEPTEPQAQAPTEVTTDAPQTDTETDPVTESETATETDAATESETTTESETESETVTEGETDTETESETDVEDETDVAEESESETDAVVELPTEFTYENGKMKVTATLSDANALPQGAEFVVEEVALSEKDRALVEAKIEEGKELADYVAYDMHFELNGQEIEPEGATVSVSVEYKKTEKLLTDADAEMKADAELQLIHIEENGKAKTAEVLDSNIRETKDLEVKKVDFATDSFSIMVLAAAARGNGNGEATDLTFTTDRFGAAYTMEYILAHYSVFVRNGVSATHIVGPVVMGELQGSSGLGGAAAPPYHVPHLAPSYIKKGSIPAGGTFITCNPDMPFYKGTSVTPQWLSLVGSLKNGTPGEVYFDYYTTDNYVDFDAAMAAIETQAEGLEGPTHITPDMIAAGRTGRYTINDHSYIQDGVLNVTLGNSYDIDTFEGITEIHFLGNALDAVNTIITNQNAPMTTVNIPAVTFQNAPPMNSETTSGAGIVFSLPDATTVNVGKNGVGHIVAPNAYVNISDGNWNGCVISDSLKTTAEMHMWPYNAGKIDTGEATVKITKTIEGAKPGEAVFNFVMKEVENPNGPVADGHEVVGTNDADGNITFPTITGYNHAGDYIYEIREQDPGAEYEDNNQVFYAKVSVKKTISGSDETYTASEPEFYTDRECTQKITVANFENKEVRKGSITVSKKVFINGVESSVGDTFHVGLFVKDGNGTYTKVPGTDIETIKADGSKVTFTDLDIAKEGTKFYVFEVDENGNPLVSQEEIPVAMVYNGYLTDWEAVDLTKAAADQEVVLENQRAKAALNGKKVVESIPNFADKKFTFTLYDVTDGTEKFVESVVRPQGTYAFKEIYYTAPGIYKYIIRETPVGEGWTPVNDLEVTVTVAKDGNGHLVATPNVNGDALTFTNKYNAASVELKLQGNKKVVAPNGGNLPKDFTFGVYEANENYAITNQTPVSNGKVEDAKLGDNGFVFDTITYTSAGTHYYVVKEIPPAAGQGWYPKTGVYNVKVVVEDNKEGKLVITTLEATLAGTAVANFNQNAKVEFVNEYKASEVKAKLKVNKVVIDETGSSLQRHKNFYFALYKRVNGEKGELIQDNLVLDATENQSNTVFFNEITYDKPGTYEYVIVEKGYETVPNEGWTPTYTERVVKVEVTDDGKGQLHAAVSAGDGYPYTINGVEFRNTYDVASTKITISGNKTLTGKEMVAGQFSFDVFKVTRDAITHAETLEKIDTVYNAADGKIDFGSITFEEEGTYEYSIKENCDNIPTGYDYDEDKEYRIKVEVVDNGKGQLVATVTKVAGIGSDFEVQNTPEGVIITGIDFVNSYKPVDTGITLTGSKSLNWVNGVAPEGEGKDKTFSFELIENGKVIATAMTDENFGFKFEIGYDKDAIGKHTYTIKEVVPTYPGYEDYDATTYTILVDVADVNGNLVATITNGNPNQDITIDNEGNIVSGIDFTNNYEPTPTDVTVSGSKVVTGDAGKDTTKKHFSFTMTNKPGTPAYSDTVTTEGAGTFTFDKIIFDKAGTYEYTVVENNTKTEDDGYTFAEYVFDVTVYVKDKGDGVLEKFVTYKVGDKLWDNIIFTNNYTVKKTSLTLKGQKLIEGNDPAASKKGFDFHVVETQLIDGQYKNVVVATGHSDGATEFNFSEITYTKAGTYTYTVKEVVPAKDDQHNGYTYTGITYPVTVHVVDDGTGTLKASVDGGEQTYQFQNSYRPADTSVVLKAQKTVTGTEDVPASEKDQKFTFEVYEGAYDRNDTTKTPFRTETVTMPTDETTIDIVFDAIKYAKEDIGNHQYSIVERKESLGGYTYDETVYTVWVQVYDDGTGQLKTKIASTESGLNGAADADSTTPGSASFTNTYDAKDVDVTLKGTKTLTGTAMAAGWFEFEVRDKDSNELVATGVNTADGKINFTTIHYDKAGTFTYVVSEKDLGKPGYDYDETTYEVVVTVTDDGYGVLHAEVEYPADGITFVNDYRTNGTNITLAGVKLVEWGDKVPSTGADDKVFTFQLEEVIENEDGTTSYVNKGTATAKLNETYRFMLTYEQKDLGIHTYRVTEIDGNLPGYEYDKTQYTVTVNVTDNGDGTISAAVTSGNQNGLHFKNKYQAKPVDVTINGSKVVTGDSGKDKEGAAKEFLFKLDGIEGTNTEDTHLEDTTTGAGDFSFTLPQYKTEGTYRYTVTEFEGTDSGYTYDGKVYDVIVIITDNGSGQLQKSVQIKSGNTAAEGGIVFTNDYKAAKTQVTLKGQKTITGINESDKTFNFVIVDETNTKVSEGTITGAGEFDFDPIVYDLHPTDGSAPAKLGLHTYKIYELEGTDAGYDYDDYIAVVTVNVYDDGSGQLKTTVTYPNDGIVAGFTNDYEAADAKLVLQAKKDITGLEDVLGTADIDKKFSFKLYKDGVKDAAHIVASAEIKGDGTATFAPELTYTTVGDFYYKMAEDKGNDPGYTYTDTEYDIFVHVYDDGSGRLKVETAVGTKPAIWPETAEVLDPLVCEFTNSYHANETSLTLTGKKTLEGRPLENNQFSFGVYENGKRVAGGTNDASGNITFEAIKYTEVGEHTYTVYEENIPVKGDPQQPGFSADGKRYTVRVSVTDAGVGQLEAKVISIKVEGETASVPVMTFQNFYRTGDTSIDLTGTKTLIGLKGVDEANRAKTFTFEVREANPKAPMGYDVVSTATVTLGQIIDANGTATAAIDFNEIPYTFEDIGTHNYTVHEINTGTNGIIYDRTVKEVTVKVTDEGEGKLKAEITEGENDINFTNEYNPEDVTVGFGGKKVLTGDAGSHVTKQDFTFVLSKEGVLGAIEEQTVKGDGAFQFNKQFTFTEAGVHTFHIVETYQEKDGYTYDGGSYDVIVTVVDDGTGKLTYTTEYIYKKNGESTPADEAVFTNHYEVAETSIELSGQKTLEGIINSDKLFNFEVVEEVNGEEVVVATAQTTGAGAIDFSTIKYTVAGNHTYTVREIPGHDDGYTYNIDGSMYTVTVSVVDNGTGTLIATVTSGNQTSLNFKNKYVPADATVTFGATKFVEGLDDVVAENPNKWFTFEVYKGGVVDANNLVLSERRQGAGDVTIGTLTYTVKDMGQTYEYLVVEKAGTDDGYTYSTQSYTVWVHVYDDGSGYLQTKVGSTKEEAEAEDTPNSNTSVSEGHEFTNTYKAAETSVTFEGTKTLEGRDVVAGQFNFEIIEMVDGEEVIVATGTNGALGANGKAPINFTAIKYTEVGEHDYIIREVNDNASGYTYDETEYPVHVSVTDDGEGFLKATVTEGGISGNDFENSYDAGDTNIVLTAEKDIIWTDGKPADAENKIFNFVVIDKDDNIVARGSVAGEGTVTFSAIEYTFADMGRHEYTVKEVTDGMHEGYIPQNPEGFKIAVRVHDNDGSGKLVAELIEGPSAGMVFVNKYEAGDAKLTLGGNKQVSGSVGKDTNKKDFTFVIEPTGDTVYAEAPMNFTDAKTITGAESFTFEEMTFTKPGTYTYKVYEQAGEDHGYTYDKTIYNVTVVAADSGEGKLTLTTTVNGVEDGAMTFTNDYKPDATSIVLSGEKSVEGFANSTKTFEFEVVEMVDGQEVVVATASRVGAGAITFTSIRYTAVGEHNYIVREKATSEPGYTADSKTYPVTVKVTDDGNGRLAATVTTGNQDKLDFVNTYKAKETSVVLGTNKAINGLDDVLPPENRNKTFTFKLYEGKTLLDTQSRDGAGSVDFSEITYTEVGLHEYTIVEVKGTLDGYTYDETQYTVYVNVYDDETGQLKTQISTDKADFEKEDTADSNYWNNSTFTNSYEAKEVTFEFGAKKTVEGLDKVSAADPNKVFTFSVYEDGIKDEAHRVAQTTHKGSGTFDIGSVTYTEVGVHNYLIVEEIGNEDGYTYSTTEYTVWVEVYDDGSGFLKTKAANKQEDLDDAADATGSYGNEFVNTYKAEEVSVTFEGTKTLEGRDLAEGQFEFEVLENGKKVAGGTNLADGTIVFDTITYDEVGKHDYIIREVPGSANGYTYDDTEYEVEVVVTDDGEGKLAATVNGGMTGKDFKNGYTTTDTEIVLSGEKVIDWTDGAPADPNKKFKFEVREGDTVVSSKIVTGAKDFDFPAIGYTFEDMGFHTYTVVEIDEGLDGYTYSKEVYTVKVEVHDRDAQGNTGSGTLKAEVVEGTQTELNFTNGYEAADVKAQVVGKKTVIGDPGKDNFDRRFEFKLEAEKGTAAYEETVARTGAGAFEFTEINFTAPGTYYYKVSEITGEDHGYTYDTTVFHVTINVTDDGNGQLAAEVVYETENGIEFVNDYQADATEVTFTGVKTVEGIVESTKNFEFEVVETIDGEEVVVSTGTVQGAGVIHFTSIKYTEIGNHTYKVREVNTGEAGYIYPTTEYVVSVSVTDDGKGYLKATVTSGNQTTLDFTNKYLPKDVSIQLGAQKTVTGLENVAEDNRAKDFVFKLYKGTDLSFENLVDTQTIQGAGEVLFDTITYAVEDMGTHVYTIVEQKGTDAGYTYDEAQYTVWVKVYDDETGQLRTKIASTEEGLEDAEESYESKDYAFTNDYEAADVTVTLEGTKNLTGRALNEGEFQFVVMEGEEVVANGANRADGTIAFDTITYTEVGVHNYTVHEVKGELGGIAYDESILDVTVTVTDDGNGFLAAEVAYPEEGIVFNNGYSVLPTSITLEADKTFVGTELTAERFAFAVTEGEDVVAAGSNDEDGNIVFSEIVYEEAGEHIYKVTEVVPEDTENIIYDTTEFEVKVTVVDNLDGTLTATAEYPEAGAAFVNKTLGNIVVTKKMTIVTDDMEIKLYTKDATFYTALFSDAEGKNRVSEVKELHIVDGATAQAEFANLETGKYYVFETTEDGTAIPYDTTSVDANGEEFACIVDSETSMFEIDTDAAMIGGQVDLNNRYIETPEEYYYAAEISIEKLVRNAAGKKIRAKDTFYAGIFNPDGSLLTVVELKQNGKVTVEVPLGGENGDEPITYVVAETNKKGKPINEAKFAYNVTVDNEKVTLDTTNLTAEVTITNEAIDEVETETEPKKVEKKPVVTTSVKTGDTTNIIVWVVVIALALAAIAYVLVSGKKRKNAQK